MWARTPGRGVTLQLQDDYSGVPLSTVARRRRDIYGLIPDFRDKCPLCGGKDCAVRHGLYFRGVVDRDGQVYEDFPVPRFRCRRRGPRRPEAVTFSVLPAQLVPRRRLSLPLMLWLVSLLGAAQRSVEQVLDALASATAAAPEPLVLDAVALYRILTLFSQAYARLQSFPVPGLTLAAPRVGGRSQAQTVAEALSRASPSEAVLSFHRLYFPNLLFDSRLRR